MSAYSFTGDRFSVHVGGRRGQGFPVPSFVVGDECCDFGINLLISQKDTFNSTYLKNKVDLQQLAFTVL